MFVEPIKVRFHGIDLIWLKSDDGSGALALPEHIADDGAPYLGDALFSDSYAHVFGDGTIWRYKIQIGTVDDFEKGVANVR
jgi:hypothetical protein